MQAAFRITPGESEHQLPVQFKLYTADSYETIKQRERRRARGWKETPKCSQMVEDKDVGWQTGGVDTMSVGRVEPQQADTRGMYEQGLRQSRSSSNEGDRDHETTELSDLLSEPLHVAFPELMSFPGESMSTDEPTDAGVWPPGTCALPVPQRIVTPPPLEYASDLTRTPVLVAGCLSGADGEPSSPAEDSPVRLTSYGVFADVHNIVHPCATSTSQSGSGADSARSGAPNRSVRNSPSIFTHVADIDIADDHDSVEPPASGCSDAVSSCAHRRRDVKRKWTADDERLLQHLRGTARLTWARIASYFPHTSQARLRYGYTKNLAIAADGEKNFTQPKRGRGRPRKHQRPSGGVVHGQERCTGPQRRTDRTEPDLFRPSHALLCDGYVAYLLHSSVS